jgi:hypothetical protein
MPDVAIQPGRFALRDLFAATVVLAACLPFTLCLRQTQIPLAVCLCTVCLFIVLELYGITRPREVRGRAFYYAYYLARITAAYFLASALGFVAMFAFPPEPLEPPKSNAWFDQLHAAIEIVLLVLLQLLVCLFFSFVGFLAAFAVAVVTFPGAACFALLIGSMIAKSLGLVQ